MAFVGGGPVVEELDAKFWRVTEPLVYRGATEEFVVPAGFRTDFASVPRALVWLIPRYGNYTRAAILHDYLLSSNAVSVADADGIFRRSLHELGVSLPRRWMMWAAVRAAPPLRGASTAHLAPVVVVALPTGILQGRPPTRVYVLKQQLRVVV
uniref:DUF1353 domain-containing protein n=1 Tax=Nocardia abscessus TaxID=120957 RepID=UPI002454BD7F